MQQFTSPLGVSVLFNKVSYVHLDSGEISPRRECNVICKGDPSFQNFTPSYLLPGMSHMTMFL